MKQRFAPFLVLLEARYAPLLFAVAPQSYAVYLWLFPQAYSLTGEVFAVLGALGYEFIYVGAIAWAEDERASWWTWGTAAVALVFSVLVAYYVYRSQGAWALLHAGFPLVAFFYTMQLHGMTATRPASAQAGAAQKPLETLPARSGAAEAGHADTLPSNVATSAPVALALDGPFTNGTHQEEWLDELLDNFRPARTSLDGVRSEPSASSIPLETMVRAQAPRYTCPHCGQALASKQALGAAVKNGHCLGCKKERAA